jgi:hypothetical protein
MSEPSVEVPGRMELSAAEVGGMTYIDPPPITGDNLAAALAKAQGEFQPIVQDRLVEVRSDKGKYDFRYATLSELIIKTRPALTQNNLAIIQRPLGKDLETVLLHSSGERESSLTPIIVREGRGHPAQAWGGAESYARRYGYAAILCLAATDESDIEAAETAAAMAEEAETAAAHATYNKRARQEMEGPIKVKTQLEKLVRSMEIDLDNCTSLDMYIAWRENAEHIALIEQCQQDLPKWWAGDGKDIQGLRQHMIDVRGRLEKIDLEGGKDE